MCSAFQVSLGSDPPIFESKPPTSSSLSIIMSTNNQPESLLQQTLKKFRHLDLTHDIIAENNVQKGGGGCSDVFQSKLSPNWRPRFDSNILKLIELKNSTFISTPEPDESEMTESSLIETSAMFDGVTVAVKRLRIWSKPDHRIEKVVSFIFQ